MYITFDEDNPHELIIKTRGGSYRICEDSEGKLQFHFFDQERNRRAMQMFKDAYTTKLFEQNEPRYEIGVGV